MESLLCDSRRIPGDVGLIPTKTVGNEYMDDRQVRQRGAPATETDLAFDVTGYFVK